HLPLSTLFFFIIPRPSSSTLFPYTTLFRSVFNYITNQRQTIMKLICIGRNYTDHIKELENEKPTDPVVFLKPDTAVLMKKQPFLDRKSTRLNSSHVKISYAVFCLKKKKKSI